MHAQTPRSADMSCQSDHIKASLSSFQPLVLFSLLFLFIIPPTTTTATNNNNKKEKKEELEEWHHALMYVLNVCSCIRSVFLLGTRQKGGIACSKINYRPLSIGYLLGAKVVYIHCSKINDSSHLFCRETGRWIYLCAVTVLLSGRKSALFVYGCVCC